MIHASKTHAICPAKRNPEFVDEILARFGLLVCGTGIEGLVLFWRC